MIPYRIDIKIEEEELSYYTRAENARHAVGKFLVECKDSELFGPDIISLCRKVIADAIIDSDEDILTYESGSIRIFCTRNQIILPEKPGDPFTDSVTYTYLNLPEYLKYLTETDIKLILSERYEFLEKNSFTLDEDDGKQYYYFKDAAEYIFRVFLEYEYEIRLEHIEGVLKTALEYDMASADHTREMIYLNAIDISSISPN